MHNDQPLAFVTRAEMQVEDVPWCRCEWLCRPGLVAAERLLLVRAIMPAGQGHRFHRHPWSEEIIYVLEGRAEQWVGRERRLLGPGDVAHVPADVVHATHNAGEGELKFLAILSPARTGRASSMSSTRSRGVTWSEPAGAKEGLPRANPPERCA